MEAGGPEASSDPRVTRWSGAVRRAAGVVRRTPRWVMLVAVLVACVGWYLWHTLPGDSGSKSAVYAYVTLEGDGVRLENLHALVDIDDDGAATVRFVVQVGCPASDPRAAITVSTVRLGAAAFGDPVPPGEDDIDPRLTDVTVERSADEATYTGTCAEVGSMDLEATVDYGDEVTLPLSSGRRAFGFQTAAFDNAEPTSTEPVSQRISVLAPGHSLLEDTFGEDERDFRSAAWEGNDLFLDAFGTIIDPDAQARAAWLDNGLLLVLGALAGLLIERALSLRWPERPHDPEED